MSTEKQRKTIMLVLSTTRQSPVTVDEAIVTAKKDEAELVVLFVNDSKIPSMVFDRMADYDFIGDKPSEELTTAIQREYCLRGNALLDEIEKKAKAEGVSCKTIIEGGEFVETCLKMVERYRVDLVIMNRMKRSAISRFFLGSAVDKLTANAPCPVKVVEEA
ncbi:MAG: universal stress protein [Nitrospirota bacterium]|nr:universal stress protein [Nitrospirota bacterium]